MTPLWSLPERAVFSGTSYTLHTDYRDILEIICYLQDPDLTEFERWEVALALFYEGGVAPEHRQAALDYLAWFIRAGQDEAAPAPKLLDWEQDAPAIIADVNRVAGQEIRALKKLHWWTFLSWFHAIGEGQLSSIVGIRDKLRRGRKLEAWEKDFYRENKSRIDLKPRLSREEIAARDRLNAMLN